MSPASAPTAHEDPVVLDLGLEGALAQEGASDLAAWVWDGVADWGDGGHVADWDGGVGWADADLEPASDPERAQMMLARPATVLDVLVLDDLDVAALGSVLLALRVSKRIDEVSAMLAARQADVLAALAGAQSSGSYLDEVHREAEVALARGISATVAGLDIELARALATQFPQFRDALARGEVSVAHCRRLVEATRLVQDHEAVRRIGELALPKAQGRTVALFGQALRRLVARLDPDAVARRAEAVRCQRDVSVQRMDDGLGRLVYVDEWTKVDAVGRRIRNAGRATRLARHQAAREARAAAEGLPVETPSPRSRLKAARKIAARERADQWRGHQDERATASGCRADAILAIVLGREHDDGTVVLDSDPVSVQVEVVIDLETLRGEADRVALLDGQPVPADVGRQWARHARTFRRMVTDPVTGHLLDRGRLYMADDVRDFVLARDGRCRVPVCGVQHRDRLQADHALPAPEGATSAANLGALSTTHHQLKTDGYLDIADSRADGSATLSTLWGQRIVIPPRAYLDEPDPRPWDRTAARPTDPDEQPPF